MPSCKDNMTSEIIRSSVVLSKNNKLLVLKSEYSSGKFYLLPGGAVEGMESAKETAVRETKEETNFNIKIKKLLYLKEWIDKKRGKNVLYVIFLGQIINGRKTHLKDPDINKKHIHAVEWKTINELKKVVFHPKDVLLKIEKDLKNNFKNNAVYLELDIIK